MNIILGNSLEKLKELKDNSVDSIVTDPPYELGFMGKGWDKSGIANNVELWAECLRVLKPGGHLLAFSGTRTYHRMASAIEDAGFEVRDMIEWVYGSGFPKSLNIGKAVDKLQGNEREFIEEYERHAKSGGIMGKDTWINHQVTKGTSEWEGWGTALKPAHEPICMARKPITEKNIAENVLKWGVGGINIDESRVGTKEEIGRDNRNIKNSPLAPKDGWNKNSMKGLDTRGKFTGRFPANLIHDNSDEVRECFPESKSSDAIRHNKKDNFKFFSEGEKQPAVTSLGFSDSGNASRFFKSILYYPKASKKERNMGCENLPPQAKVFNGQSDKPSKNMKDVEKRFTTQPKQNNHPTVKPIALMEYLIKMVTPKGGIVLDPFMGSGSTGVAAKKNGYDFIGIDMTPEYVEIAKARINATEIENRLI